ncbi:hypothetical protein ACOMHN_037866 [Nucella lapillus]
MDRKLGARLTKTAVLNIIGLVMHVRESSCFSPQDRQADSPPLLPPDHPPERRNTWNTTISDVDSTFSESGRYTHIYDVTSPFYMDMRTYDCFTPPGVRRGNSTRQNVPDFLGEDSLGYMRPNARGVDSQGYLLPSPIRPHPPHHPAPPRDQDDQNEYIPPDPPLPPPRDYNRSLNTRGV